MLLWPARGKTDAEIADFLVVSVRTVQTHVEHILVKLGVETRIAAAARAFEVTYQRASRSTR